MDQKNTAPKSTIWYSRTYRKLHIDYLNAFLFILFLMIPCLVALVLCIEPITRGMASLAQGVLSEALPGKEFLVESSEYIPFGTIHVLAFDCSLPSAMEIAINIAVVVGLVAILTVSKYRGRPVIIYLNFSFMIHIISCIFFSFVRTTTIYSGKEFTEIITKQQISVWMLFIVLMGVVLAFFGNRGLGDKILAFVAVLLYSGIIGVLRYIVFIFILANFSALYMADMYFVIGPIFDFLYLVGVYAIYSSRMQKVFDSPAGEGEWRWL